MSEENIEEQIKLLDIGSYFLRTLGFNVHGQILTVGIITVSI